MNKKFSILFAIFFGLLMAQPAFTKVKLPALVSSNMVLQRNTEVTLWGWADPGEKISIEYSWLIDVSEILADEEGNWKVGIKTTDSKEAQTIKITDETSEITLFNVVFGEVWVCSGQSNMQQPVNGYHGQPTFGTLQSVAHSRNSNIRLFSVHRVGSKTPLEDIDSYDAWEEASPENVPEFSSVAWYFGKQLQEILDVPVGMIHTSWGGSAVEAWISKEAITPFQEVDLSDIDITQKTNHIPTALFNSMINPLIPYTIKGALWYQGESNRLEPDKYTEFFPAMVKDWRNRWGIGDFPFYYVQIAPYSYGGNQAYNTSENSAFIREAQLKCLDIIPNSGMAVTMDIGEEQCIHPAKKKEVADRLLYNALNKTYGMKSLECESPVYKSHEVEDGAMILSFDNASKGMYATKELTSFEIAGEDKVFYPAKAEIYNRTMVRVYSPSVPKPVAVRYAWKNWVSPGLFDTNLLPASSFRTDNWDDAELINE